MTSPHDLDRGDPLWAERYDELLDALQPRLDESDAAWALGMMLDCDRDPAALAWARASVQQEIDWVQRMLEQAEAKGSDSVPRWKFARFVLRRLIGGDTCVIGAFDHRRPQYLAAMDNARPIGGAS